MLSTLTVYSAASNLIPCDFKDDTLVIELIASRKIIVRSLSFTGTGMITVFDVTVSSKNRISDSEIEPIPDKFCKTKVLPCIDWILYFTALSSVCKMSSISRTLLLSTKLSASLYVFWLTFTWMYDPTTNDDKTSKLPEYLFFTGLTWIIDLVVE